MSARPFHGNDRPTLGVELELQLVDARSMALTSVINDLIPRLPAELLHAVKPEFLQCYVEIISDAGRTPAEVGGDLAGKVRRVADLARGLGARFAWGATHPFSRWHDQKITPDPRYRELAELLQETVRRPATFGLHVHVGVDSGDNAVRVMNRIQPYLPALLALSANSPFWCGRATGLLAHRVEVLEVFPTGGLPPRLKDWAEYSALVDRLAGFGLIQTEKELWWDVRPNPHHGTVEVRVCDMPADLPAVIGLSALIQCLVHDLATSADPDPGPDPAPELPLVVRQNRWRAARFGLAAGLVDPRTGAITPASRVLTDLIDRLAPLAERLGCPRELAHARLMSQGPTGAERQLAVYQQTRDLAAVVRHLTGEAPDAPPARPRPVPGAFAPLVPPATGGHRPFSLFR